MFPRLLVWGDFVLPTYGLTLALAFLVGLVVASRLAARQGMEGEAAFNLGIYAALAAIVGAKVLMVAEDWSFYSDHPREIFSLVKSGGVFYGGFLAALGVSAWYIRRQGLPFLKTSDAFAPGVALGHAIGRLGCFAAGCCWGKPTALAWGVTFTDPYAWQIVGVPLGVRLHPTQLYESLAEALIFLVLLAVWKRKRFDGQVLSLYLVLYGAARFLIEFARDHPAGGMFFGGRLSTSQLIALLLIPAGLALWVGRRRVPVAPLPRARIPHASHAQRF